MLSQRRYRPWNRLALLWHQPRKISNGSNSCCIAMLGVSENGEMMFRFCLVIFLFYIKDWEKGGVISFRILCLNMSSDNIQCSTFHTSLSALDLMSSCIHTNLSLSFFWSPQTRYCQDACGAVADGMDKKVKDIESLIGIETDDDVGHQVPPLSALGISNRPVITMRTIKGRKKR